MTQRLDYQQASPAAFQAMLKLQLATNQFDLEDSLVELVKIRASQMNGCAWCLNMHIDEARALGEDDQRLFLLPTWREAPVYTPRERAALSWTEALIDLASQGTVTDAIYDEARAHFSEQELVELTLAIVAINGWNQLNVAFRTTIDRPIRPASEK